MAKTKLVPKSWIPAGPYSLGTKCGNTIFLAGQIATANDGSIIGDTVQAQTEIVIDKMVEILTDGGMGLEDVMQTTVYMQDLDDYNGMNEVYAARFAEPYPARATVRADLAGAGLRVEISCIAMKD